MGTGTVFSPPFCLHSQSVPSVRCVELIMDTILKRLNLGSLIDKFETEHITPDLVCKLSVHEMEVLGVNSRSDIRVWKGFRVIRELTGIKCVNRESK